MPLPPELRSQVLGYCDAHLPDDASIGAMFDFIDDPKLKIQIESEFYAARYIYKLGEALAVDEDRLHAHVKFQIVQYAGIYEAIIVFLLWSRFASHPAVTSIQFHQTYRVAASLPNNLSLTSAPNGEDIFLCAQVSQKTPTVSIKFDDKVDAAISIGFVDADVAGDIKRFYRLRNAIHLESAVKNAVRYELSDSQLAFLRMQPFTVGVRGFLRSGRLPDVARLRPSSANSRGDEGVGSLPDLAKN